MRVALALVLLSACGVECSTRCGLSLMAPATSAWTCESFQTVEEAALLSWSLFLNRDAARSKDFEAACSRLSVYRVVAHDEEFIPYPSSSGDGGRVSAYTDCSQARIELGHRPPPLKSALVHELAHAVTSCNVWCRPDDPEYNTVSATETTPAHPGTGAIAPYHCGWTAWGLFDAEKWVHGIEVGS